MKPQDGTDDLGSLLILTVLSVPQPCPENLTAALGETKKGYFLSLSTGSRWQCGNDPPESFGLLAAGRESNRSVIGVD